MSVFTPDIPSSQQAVQPGRPRRLPVVGITVALVSLWLGIVWAAVVPPMNAPDEPAYLQAVMETRNKRMLPEIHFDFSQNPKGDIVGDPGDLAARDYAAQRNMNVSIRLVPYQNSQPPLYFMIAGPVAMLLPDDPQIIMYASRLISVLFGAGTVFFCWAAARQLAPRSPMWAVAAAGVIALLPEFSFNNARVANDSLVNCLGAAAFYVWFRGLRRPDYDPLMLRAGALVGLALLAKLTAVALIPGLALVVLFRAFQNDDSSRPKGYPAHRPKTDDGAGNLSSVVGRLSPVPSFAGSGILRAGCLRLSRGARMAAGAAGAALLVCGWWLVRNMIVYGDLTGTAAVNRFYAMTIQPPGFSLATPDQQSMFVDATWKSLWGFFGWQTIFMPGAFYSQVDLFTLILSGLTALAAVIFIARRFTMRNVECRMRNVRLQQIPHLAVWQSAVVLAVVGIALLVSFVEYSLQVAAAPQGRYLYLMLLPAALLFTGGPHFLAPGRILKIIALSLPLLWLGVMNFVALGRVQ